MLLGYEKKKLDDWSDARWEMDGLDLDSVRDERYSSFGC